MVEDRLEEETYSLIYTSLKHPIRRKILRMLASKSLTFSEILEILKIDSGHLSYHLECLGDLTTHLKDEKYTLSSFGVAAIQLMDGVEDNYPAQVSNHKHRISKILPKVWSIIFITSLIVASIYFLTFSSIISTATLNQDNISPTPFTIDAGQARSYNITLEYWKDLAPMIGNPIFSRAHFVGSFAPHAYKFEVEPPPNTYISQTKGILWLDFELNTTSRKPETLVLMPFGFPNDLEVDICAPNENMSLGKLDWTYGKINHFTSPTVIVNQLGTYQFVIRNSDSNEWTGVLRPYVEWQIIEKPLFLYGILGLTISIIYIVFVLFSIKQKKKNKKIE